MWLFYGQNPASSAPKCTPTMGSQDGYHRADDESDGNGALEDHRAGDVAEGQGVLAVPHPEDGVELLGQLGRQGREHEGYQTGGQPKSLCGMLDRVDEEVRARDDHPEARERLEDDRQERRVLSARQEQELLRHLLEMLARR